MTAKGIKYLVVAGVAAIFLAAAGTNAVYTIHTGQEAVIKRFGKYLDTVAQPGVNFKLPFIDEKIVVDVNTVHRMEFGFLTGHNGEFEDDYQVSKMLTGDENIAIVETIVQYQIKSPKDYLFSINDIDGTLRIISESSIRRSIASHTLDEALTENKNVIQLEIMEDLQALCDKYDSGIKIVGVQLQDVNPPPEVDEAFRDVAGAREDKNAYINEANAYKNEVLPTARGEAATLINSATAYANNRLESAEAQVTAYEQLYEKYLEGPETTRTRMYLETLSEVLEGNKVYIMQDDGNMKLFNID